MKNLLTESFMILTIIISIQVHGESIVENDFLCPGPVYVDSSKTSGANNGLNWERGAINNKGNLRIGFNGNSSPVITNFTFVNNITTSQASGIIHTEGIDNGNAVFAHPIINNSIFWNNGIEISNDEDAITTITNSIIKDAAQDAMIDPIAGTTFNGTNLDAYPMFQDCMNGNFRLMTGSPAIDAGDSSLVQSVYDTQDLLHVSLIKWTWEPMSSLAVVKH